MPFRFRRLAAEVLDHVRQQPWLHGPVHKAAELMVRTRWGERLVGSILQPDSLLESDYRWWIRHHDTLSPEDRADITAHIGRMAARPLISVVMPAYATPPDVLRAAIRSVQAQLYPNWELCIADDGSPGEALWRVLQAEASADPRIRIVRRPVSGHICAATNSALALATGEFVALMDHDDILADRALYEVAAVLERRPDADLIYSDEDKIDDRGRRFEPYFKTDWNPDLMLGQNMVSHLGVYRRALVLELGGLREGFEGSQDYDLALRVSERTTRERIHHIPAVLYHWRQKSAKASFSEAFMAQCAASAKRAVEEHLARTGVTNARVENKADWPGWLHVRRSVPDPKPLVSIIVPTRDRADLLERCCRGVLEATEYPDLELIVVDNGSEERATRDLFGSLAEDPRVRIIAAPGPFNFSHLNNLAAAEARGEVLVLLNNDIGVREPGWLEEMVSHAVRPEVGAVGCKLLYPDGTVQHAGVILGVGAWPPVAGHAGHGQKAESTGYFGRLALTHNVSAVTAACLAIRRSVFQEVGGLDEERLKVAFNDVDLCLKVRRAGYDIVLTPLAVLDHHESASRGSDLDPARIERFKAEIAVMRERWGEVLDNDPFYSPMLNKLTGDFTPGLPPTRSPPWRISSGSPR